MQGHGLYAKEEVVFDNKGGLTTSGPLAYRIPRCTDIPGQLNVRLLKDLPNPKAAIYSPKVRLLFVYGSPLTTDDAALGPSGKHWMFQNEKMLAGQWVPIV